MSEMSSLFQLTSGKKIRKRIFNVWKANELETKYGLYVEGKGLAQYYTLRHSRDNLGFIRQNTLTTEYL